MEINRVHHLNFLDNALPDKCANLIIADPPYFEVKGAFDFVWADMKEYLEDVVKWAIECKRLLADNGTLFWFGDAKNIAYSQVIIDEHLNLINNLVWEKAEANGLFGLTGSEQLRSFPKSTERVLMYCKEKEDTGLQLVLNDQTLFIPIRDYFQEERKKTPLSYKEINKKCFSTASNGGGMASNILTSYKDGWTFPTKEKYDALQKIGICQKPYDELKMDYELLKAEYEALRLQHEETRRPFNNFMKSTEVLKVRFTPSKYDHETVKPEKLARLLIETCSRKNDLVLVPFAGSGTEVAMSVKECRRAIGFDIESKYVEIANRRVQGILKQPTLF